jgi:methylmalonyl-CoA/ethylmalonyl-CoA epimerase
MSAHFDHVAIATWSIRDAYALFSGCLGGVFLSGGDDDRHMRTMLLSFGAGNVELMQPIDGSSYLHAYLERKGQGFHHMTLLCDNVEEEAARLTECGYELVEQDLSRPTWREVYVRPKVGFGTLIQLFDSVYSWDAEAVATRTGNITAEDVMDGRVVWREDTPVMREDAD